MLFQIVWHYLRLCRYIGRRQLCGMVDNFRTWFPKGNIWQALHCYMGVCSPVVRGETEGYLLSSIVWDRPLVVLSNKNVCDWLSSLRGCCRRSRKNWLVSIVWIFVISCIGLGENYLAFYLFHCSQFIILSFLYIW